MEGKETRSSSAADADMEAEQSGGRRRQHQHQQQQKQERRFHRCGHTPGRTEIQGWEEKEAGREEKTKHRLVSPVVSTHTGKQAKHQGFIIYGRASAPYLNLILPWAALDKCLILQFRRE